MTEFEIQKFEYLNYIAEHKDNVVKACFEIGKELCNILNNNYFNVDFDDLQDRCFKHDESKYHDEEFIPYLNYFYSPGGKENEQAKVNMNAAFLHHQNVNDHHPEYWILIDNDLDEPWINALPMSGLAIAEMICDWYAMGMKFNNTPYKWFMSKQEYYQKMMNENTYKLVEKIVNHFWNK